MEMCILLKYGELILKGLNKRHFENLLLESLRRAVAPYGDFRVYAMQSTVYIQARRGSGMEERSSSVARGDSSLDAETLCVQSFRPWRDQTGPLFPGDFSPPTKPRTCEPCDFAGKGGAGGEDRPPSVRCADDAPVGESRGADGISFSTGEGQGPGEAGCDFEGAFEAAKKVFGVSALSLCALCEKDMGRICQTAAAFLAPRLSEVSSFKVEARRSDKRFPLNSPQICAQAGEFLCEKFPHLRVNVHTPEMTVFVEIRDQYACIHEQAVRGAGGMPVGGGGRGMLLISGGIDSPVAGYMMAKRGISLRGVHFFSHPYTSERAKDKVKTLLKKVSEYAGPIQLTVVPFTEIQEKIRECCDEEYFTLIMRAFMMKIAERAALEQGCAALITGESLGQVASQTMEAIGVTDSYTALPVLRPVIGMDKAEIIEIARKIDTFETSILPYEDCCTVFTPRHPRTKPKLADVQKQMAKLEVEALIERAMAGVETLRTGSSE